MKEQMEMAWNLPGVCCFHHITKWFPAEAGRGWLSPAGLHYARGRKVALRRRRMRP